MTNDTRNKILQYRKENGRLPSKRELIKDFGVPKETAVKIHTAKKSRKEEPEKHAELTAFLGASRVLSIVMGAMIIGCIFLSFRFTKDFCEKFFFDNVGAIIVSLLTVLTLSINLPIGEVLVKRKRKGLAGVAFVLWGISLLFSITSTVGVAYNRMSEMYLDRATEEATRASDSFDIDQLLKREKELEATLSSLDRDILTKQDQISETQKTKRQYEAELQRLEPGTQEYDSANWYAYTAGNNIEEKELELAEIRQARKEIEKELTDTRNHIIMEHREISVEKPDTFFNWLHRVFPMLPVFWIQFIQIIIPAVVVDFINAFGSVVILVLNEKRR